VTDCILHRNNPEFLSHRQICGKCVTHGGMMVQVLENIDELFDREELSAAPDAGWPDCFNSGVFVFCPSLDTYRSLLQFAVTHGSFDGMYGQHVLLSGYSKLISHSVSWGILSLRLKLDYCIMFITLTKSFAQA